MQIFDTMTMGQAVEVAGTRSLRNGALVVDARVARGGNVQTYSGAEVGRPDMPIVRVYRDTDEIFRKESLATFPHKTITLDHPTSPVTAATWRNVARGHIGDEVARDGEFVRIPMLVADGAAVEAIRTGKRELSVGYDCRLVFSAGTTPAGEAYDARQTNVVVDHVAIVMAGRAGPACRIGDAATPGLTESRVTDVDADAIRRETAWLDSVRQMGDAASEVDIHLMALPSALRPRAGAAFVDATCSDPMRQDQGLQNLRDMAFGLGSSGLMTDTAAAQGISAMITLAGAEGVR